MTVPESRLNSRTTQSPCFSSIRQLLILLLFLKTKHFSSAPPQHSAPVSPQAQLCPRRLLAPRPPRLHVQHEPRPPSELFPRPLPAPRHVDLGLRPRPRDHPNLELTASLVRSSGPSSSFSSPAFSSRVFLPGGGLICCIVTSS